MCLVRCRRQRKRQRSWNEQVLSGNGVSVHTCFLKPEKNNRTTPVPILGHSHSPSFVCLSLTSRTFNPADCTGSAEAGDPGSETTEGAGECSLLFWILDTIFNRAEIGSLKLFT